MAFDYAEVETVLARLYHADAVQRGAFRGRIAHLRRLGIPIGQAPGKGRKIVYEKEHVYQLALCLELEEFGIDPLLIASFVKQFWTTFYGHFIEAEMDSQLVGPEDTPSDLCFAIEPAFMSKNWHRQAGAVSESFPGLIDFIPFRTAEDARYVVSKRRLCTLNLSMIVRMIRQTIVTLGMADRLPDHLKPARVESR